jgi:acyl carrier protein
VESVLLGVVAEKTGYPREMLEARMDLEADLGVDSIKRVEILGTLQDQIPELPTIRGEELGELRTLAQITDYLKNQLPETSAGVPPRASEVPAPEADASGGSDPAAALQAVISEKTGYPVEMLELGMELEADLGVDSIKRVEIMWAIQEKFPELPPINNAEVAELRTLQQITDHLQANLSKAPINGGEATNGSGEDSSNGHTVFQPDVETLSSNLLAIIAEKTGYPTDMLELSMDLEADLGVDSIKRVEIMWAVQEKFPVLPQLNNSELGELRTLQQIIDRLATELPGLPTAALAASPATAQKKNL